MKKLKNRLVILVLLLQTFLFSCLNVEETELSFYHWETALDLSTEEDSYLEEMKTSDLYIKFFDLVLLPNQSVAPVAIVNFEKIPAQHIIPVIYITTPVFTELDSAAIQKLAHLTATKIQNLYPQEKLTEIQIDCDWMTSIKARYFYFLSCLKAENTAVKISVTIRLYQYKYPNLAGVPPVDKGVLMYYNMGELTDYKESNSILNNELGKDYLGFGEYPLPLDFALPRFSWTLRFRYGQFVQIMPTLNQDHLMDKALFFAEKTGYYRLKKDTLLDGSFLRQGDEFRFESCTEDELVRAATLLKPEKNQDHTKLIFYDLNPSIIYEKDKINSVFTAF